MTKMWQGDRAVKAGHADLNSTLLQWCVIKQLQPHLSDLDGIAVCHFRSVTCSVEPESRTKHLITVCQPAATSALYRASRNLLAVTVHTAHGERIPPDL